MANMPPLRAPEGSVGDRALPGPGGYHIMVTRHAGRAQPTFMLPLPLTFGNSCPAAMECLSKSADRAAMAHDPAIVPPQRNDLRGLPRRPAVVTVPSGVALTNAFAGVAQWQSSSFPS